MRTGSVFSYVLAMVTVAGIACVAGCSDGLEEADSPTSENSVAAEALLAKNHDMAVPHHDMAGHGDGGVHCGTHLPSPVLTPGWLCTDKDPNFDGYRYKEKIAHCARNVPAAEKDMIAASYGGIPQSDYPKYEFDHYIPLSIGGSDDIRNLWPQILVEAKDKDTIEQTVFDAMNAGTMTQGEALAKIRAWRPPGVTCP